MGNICGCSNFTSIKISDVNFDNTSMFESTTIHSDLKVTFSGFPTNLLCGELQKVKVTFSNEGEGSLHKLHAASSNVNLLAFDGSSSDNKDINVPEFQKKQSNRFVQRVSKISLPHDCLNAKDKMESIMWVQGRQKSGISNEEVLFYYESADGNASMRCVQGNFKFDLQVAVVNFVARPGKYPAVY